MAAPRPPGPGGGPSVRKRSRGPADETGREAGETGRADGETGRDIGTSGAFPDNGTTASATPCRPDWVKAPGSVARARPCPGTGAAPRRGPSTDGGPAAGPIGAGGGVCRGRPVGPLI
ncbi:hypothetical protein GCM10010172_69780 [Paractinoplanes ferrugineus]|uniref:Uncharacterized protein n=1 Tax=Paractinoplanes ferrugineus TaxID=113564 RepID=A0A919MF38_9ACTN|nr:hypothetical protein Afe05nite_41890 [Actinoplanes ferrugineus]